MPDLENKKSVEHEKRKGQGLKILTPNQMLSRLPISLARLEAGNNSEKLKNEIRQLFIFYYIRSKNYPKQSIIIWSILFETGDSIYEHRT